MGVDYNKTKAVAAPNDKKLSYEPLKNDLYWENNLFINRLQDLRLNYSNWTVQQWWSFLWSYSSLSANKI